MKENIVINLNEKRIDESWMSMFGANLKYMLDQMGIAPMAGGGSSISIRGLPSQIQAFAGTLMGEKAYMKSAARYGLTDPRTYQNQATLNRSIKNFERATGIKYPIK